MSVVSRLAALVVAVGLVVAAFAVRSGGDGDTDTDRDVVAGGSVALACPQDLPAVCAALGADGVTVVPRATRDAANAAAAAPLTGAWVVPTSWADVVDDERRRAQPPVPALLRGEVVATSPIVLVGYEVRVDALAAACAVPAGEVGIACAGELAGQQWAEVGGRPDWGRVGLAHASPDTTTGLLATATVAAGLAGADFGATELREPGTAAALRRIEDSVDGRPGVGGVVGSLRSTGPSYADLVVAPEADVVGIDQPAQGPLAVVVPDPTFAVELVVVADDPDVLAAVTGALGGEASIGLAGAGWRVDGPPPGSPLTGTPAVAPRPDGASLVALRLAWAELTG